MTEQLIDLTKFEFWLVLLVAVVLVGPLKISSHKSVAWAAINCGFIFLILQLHGLFMIAAVIAVYFMLQRIAGRFRNLSTIIASLILLILFLVHKNFFLEQVAPLSPVRTILSITGFSYIALRMVEVIRAVFEKRQPPPSLISTINYLIPFHMLAAGPIQAYEEFASQSDHISTDRSKNILPAIERIVFGLFKKFVLAYTIHELFLTGFESQGLYFFIEVQFFFLWLYLDFSAYSDIAIGIGYLLGIATPENFNRPYLARNAIDFWERWHITLSQFVKRNIFIPIQLYLNRRNDGARPLLSASIAFFIAFVACGLWHGLTLNFMLWGAFHAIGLIVTNLYRSYLKKRLGTQGVKKYLANKSIESLARVITYQFVAFSLVLLFYP